MKPQKVVCVVKKDGKEIGRVAATAPNAIAYVDNLVRHHGNCSIEYVEDEDEAAILRNFSR